MLNFYKKLKSPILLDWVGIKFVHRTDENHKAPKVNISVLGGY